jgi:GntR family transcriptional regulator, regulator for abcA and norABC
MAHIDWKPNRDLEIPIQVQIIQYIKEKIENGEWTVGTILPSQRKLAELFDVNRSTIVSALGELTADGLLETKIGSGTTVSNTTWNLLAAPAPDWQNYVQSGMHEPNFKLIQAINLVEADPSVIRLGTGELAPELLPSEEITSLLHNADTIPLGYSEPKGSYALRLQLSRFLQCRDIHVSPAAILITSGSLQALQLIAGGLLAKGSTILYESPSYIQSVPVFQSAGTNIFGLAKKDIDITQQIRQYMRTSDATLFYANPTFHNPTGRLWSTAERQSLLLACQQLFLPIIEDDAYYDLWLDAPPPPPLKALDTQGNVLYTGSFSKSMSPGIRIGWIAGPEPVIDRLADSKMQTDYGASSLSQYVVERWLATGIHLQAAEKIRTALRKRRDAVLQLLQEHFEEIASWTKPQGGFYIWLKLHQSVPIHTLFEKALQQGILLNPGQIYDRNDSHHLRISYSYASIVQLEYALKQLASLIGSIQKDPSENS